MEEVECAVCGAQRSRKRSRGIYVEAAGVQYVCFTCRRRSFDEVMDGLLKGAVYVRGTAYRNRTEMERARARAET